MNALTPLEKDVSIDTKKFTESRVEQPRLYAQYAARNAEAQLNYLSAKRNVALLEANLDKQYRDAYTKAGIKITETVIANEILRDASYQAALVAQDMAQIASTLSLNSLEALRQRGDMLVQLGDRIA